MTVREYINGKFRSFGLTDAQLEEVGFGIPLDNEFTIDNAEQVGKAMCVLVEEMVFFPKQRSVNESGFSVSWDFDNLAKYYLYLCRRYGRKPDDGVLSLMGISTIIDKTNIW